MVYDLSHVQITYTSSYGVTVQFQRYNYYQTIYNGLMSLINNSIGVCALMGNLQSESYIVPFTLQGDNPTSQTSVTYTTQVNKGAVSADKFIHSGDGYGLAQWTWWSRKRDYYNFWQASGIESIGDTQVGLDWLKHELQKDYPTTLSVLQNATDIRTASDYVLFNFENPAEKSEDVQLQRASQSEYYYKLLGGTSPTSEVKITPTYLEMQVNTSHVFTATTTLSAPTVTWTTTGVLSVTNTDNLRCTITANSVGSGTVTITVSDSSGSYSATANVTVISGTPTPTGDISVSPLYVPLAFVGDVLDFTIVKSGSGTVTCIPYGGIDIISASDTLCTIKCSGIGQAHLNVALHDGDRFIASATATINIAPRSGGKTSIYYTRNTVFKLFS